MNHEYIFRSPSFKIENGEEGGGSTGDGMELVGGAVVPFHPRIDHAKSIQLLQELQNEVGALLEFRDVVMEAFPQLRAKVKGGGGRWEPGVRVRRKQQSNSSPSVAVGVKDPSSSEAPRSRSNSRSKGSSGGALSTLIQDSGFSTADSSGTTGTASKKHLPPEDELWGLLELIQAKGTKLRLEVECMKERCSLPIGLTSGRSRSLQDLRCPSADVLHDKEELSLRVAELEAENVERGRAAVALSRRVSQLQEDKRRLEGELAEARVKRGLTTPIPSSPAPSSASTSVLGRLDGLVSSPAEVIPCPKGLTPDRHVMAAILQETNVLELQRHLITTTHYAQVVQTQMEKAVQAKANLIAQLAKSKDDVEDLRFQLEEKRIELEGTRARVRILEKGNCGPPRNGCGSESSAPQSEDNSSTESGRGAVNGCTSSSSVGSNLPNRKSTSGRPSRIPLKACRAPPNSLIPQSPQPPKIRPPTSNTNKLSFFSSWLRMSNQ